MKNIPALGKSGYVSHLRRATRLQVAVVAFLMPGLTIWTSPVMANPRGGNVVHGDVNIGPGTGGNLQIRQNSRNAIINWDSFSIQAGELTQFRQPNKNAAVLNRVTGGDPSAIHGALKANGNVFVINPNGILVGPGGTIDVHGLVLSTLDVDNGEFLAGGDMTFNGVGEGVTNLGRINAIGGDVFLIGRTVSNSGSITATGTVGLAAGEEVLLTAGEGVNGERMFVRAKGSGASGTGVFNDGSIEGAAVELKAHGNVYALAINNKGSIRATGASTSGGRVFLRGAGGSVSNSGSIRATSSGAGNAGRVLIEAAYAKVDGMIRAQGGEVRITGTDKVEMSANLDATGVGRDGGDVVIEGGEITLGSTAVVDVSGDTGGGRARIGGGFQGRDAEVANAGRVLIDDGALLRADALAAGKGGSLIVWSDEDTRFAGDLSARGVSKGGFAEISGKSTLEVGGDIDLTAVSGPAGTLLLDPTNITISATGATGLGGSTISNLWLSEQLDAGNNVVVATSGAGAELGNITVGRTTNTTDAVNDRIQWYQDSAATPGGTLTLLAFGDIFINTAIQSAGQGGVNLVAGWDGFTGLLPGDFDMAAVLATMPGGSNEGAVDAAGYSGTAGTATSSGSVFLGATNSRIGVGVGSRWGDTNVAARDLIMRGSTAIGHGWAQLGFNDNGVEYELSRSQNGNSNVLNEWWGSPLGNVQGKNYIALLGGTEFGTGDSNTLGTNAFRGAGWGASGNITAGLSGRVDARGGTTASFVQIGHGGVLQDGSEWKRGQTATTLGGQVVSILQNSVTTRDGIVIDPADNRRSFFASTWRTNYAGDAARIDGDISLSAEGDILFMSARDFDGTTDMLNTNVNTSAYALIGHGGEENHGSYHGDITVEARGVTSAPTGSGAANRGLAGLGIQILGGRGSRSFAAIGHMSGYEGNRRSVWDQTRSGNISVTASAGAIRLQAHNQAIRNGNLNTGALITGDTPTGLGNASDNSNLGSYVQIGHGGQNSDLPAAGGAFTMPGGTGVSNIVPDSSASGDISIFAGGTYVDPENADTPIGILVRAGNRRWQHAMIGHGGTNHNAVNATDQTPDFGATAMTPFATPVLTASTGFNGNVRVEADKGSIIATGGDNFRADRVWGYGLNFVQIGHGGDTVRGNKGGTISVSAGQGLGALSGDIKFQAGRMFRDHAMLGHGGYDSDGSILGADNTAEINVTARGDISFISPPSGDKDALALSSDYAYWWFSNGSAAGTPQTNQPGYWQTEDRFVQLGHGGYASTTIIPNRQDITVTAGTGDSGNADGDAATGGITFVTGDMERDYAQLGHGGHSAGANNASGFTGDINVNSLGGGIRFDGSILGAQGIRRATDRSLNGIANTVTTVGFGGGYEAYAQLGHGGYGARGINTGDIVVNAWGGLDFLAAPAAPVVNNTVTTAPVDAALNAGTNVWVQLAGLRDPIATPSTLAFQTSGILSNVIPGTIRIELEDGRVITDLSRNSSDDRATTNSDTSPNGLFLDGVKVGETNYDWGIIRFNNTTNPLVGTWAPGTPAVVTFQTAQGLKERAYVQLGHGGYEADGPNNKANDLISNRGNITVLAGGDINFQGGAAHRNYAQLGHGGLDTKGSSGGNITIDHIDAGNPLGTVGGITFLAGHGGHRQFDYHSYAQLGHGGIEADGNHFGNIFVRGTENADGMGLFLKAGDRQDAYAQIGHGGLNARTGTTTPGRTYFGLNGDIDIQVTGDVAVVAGTLRNNNPAYRDDGRLMAQIGHGGYDADATNDNTSFLGQTPTNPLAPIGTYEAGEGSWGHFGDITLVSTSGNISFMAGSNIPVANRLDLDGNPLPIPADPNGYLTSHGDGKGRFLWTQIGHGGYAASGNHHGNVTVISELGSVHVVGGMMSNDNSADKFNWAQIGNAGGNAQGNLGRTNETIKVNALGANGNILVAAGNGNRTQALIGNGGINFDGNHKGNIEVYAGRNIDLRGGIALERVVRRIGEFQALNGVDGGNANDIGEFNGYYGTGGLGYVLLDEAASTGGGVITKLMGDEIQPGTVQFRLAIAAPTLYDAAKTPEYQDDGAGNIVETANPANIVGTINYATGELRFDQSIVTNTAAQPDVFVDYDHRTGIRNDAIYANATIGHGGYSTNSLAGAHPEDGTPGFVNRGIAGDIDVRAGVDATGAFTGSGGSITAIAGNDQRTYVQIGHGGMDGNQAAGHAHSGAITTKADGGINFRGGGGLVDNQDIAFNYYGTGNTEVTAVTTAYNATVADPTRYATSLGTGTRSNSGITDILFAFAHIGHGGVTVHANGSIDNNSNNPLAAPLDPATGHNGNILVETSQGNVNFSGGGKVGYGHFAMIGHGGYSVLGNHFGDIDVISGADINFIAGGDTYRANSTEGRNFVQIGHGGRTSTGNLAGDIDVSAAGAIALQGGDSKSDRSRVPYGAHVFVLNQGGNQDENHYNRTEGRLSRAQIGHGGDQFFGDKSGNIDVTAGGGINVRGGDRVEGSLDNNAGYLNFAQIGHGGYGSWRQYRTNINFGGNLGQADDWGIPFWHDGTQYVFDGSGQFPWPSDNSINPSLGLGNPLHDGFSGDVTVTANAGNISFQGGTSVATFAKVGHGGVETGGNHSGNLTVTASAGDIDFSANRIEETASTSTATYTFAQIGHGGAFSSGDANGNIDVSASGKIRFKAGRHDSFAMVGHGGRESHGSSTIQWGTSNPVYRKTSNFLYSQNSNYRPGTRTGDISVDAGGNIEFIGGNSNGDRAFTQVGHGGFNIHADPASANGDGHSGAISVVTSGGSILLKGGDRANSHALIGHGGTESFGNHGGDGTDARADSDILVEAGTGIRVQATGRFDSNNVARNFAQIGHGGWRSSFRDIEDIDGNRYGKLQPYGSNYTNPVTNTTNANNSGLHPLTPSTTDVEGFAWRHPDRPWGIQATLGTFKGDITVRTTGTGADIRFIAPDASEGTLGVRGEDSYVQLGHGGWRNFADIEGDITVESGGALEFRALQGTANAPNTTSNHNVAFAQLGHGGFESGGKYTGNIDVTTGGDILFRGADSINGANAGYAQMGHGGYTTWVGTTQYREALRDPATGTVPGSVFSTGSTGNITVDAGGDISFLAGRDFATYAQIGHGGYASRDSHTGDIGVTAAGGIRFIASIDDVGGPGDNPGNNNGAFAQIGHGGYESDGSHSGNITVRGGEFAAGPQAGYGLYFKSGNWTDNFSQLGHGGYGARSYGNGVDAVGFQGNIDVEVNGDITFVAGTWAGSPLFSNEDGRNYTQLGHGGTEADTSQNNAVLTGLVDASGNPVGHSGDIRVVAKDGSINFLGGDIERAFEPSAGLGYGNNHYAQLGHGGISSHGNHYGNITVQAGITSNLTVGSKGDGDILFASGGSSANEWADIGNYAQLGHGGRGTEGNFGLRDALGNALETVTVMAGRDLTFSAADGSPSSYVQLGHGGWGARGDHYANMQVFAERHLNFQGANQFNGVPALGDGRFTSYGHGSRTDGNNATINQDRAGNLADGANFNLMYNRVVPGSLKLTIRLDSGTIIGTLSDPDGDGTLTADGDITADFLDGNGTRTITAGTTVGTVVYSDQGTSTVTFNQDVNPGATTAAAPNENPGDSGTVNIWVQFQHGDQDQAYAMLGHGGWDSDSPNDSDLINGNKGNISVAARTGNISLNAGFEDDTFAMIGHGGRSTRGANTGNITIRAAGNLGMTSGNRNRAVTFIGHGGAWESDGNHSGDIIASAGSGQLFTSLSATKMATGGWYNDLGDFDGIGGADEIQFAPLAGGVSLLGGNGGDYTAAQIGHGGYTTSGDFSGDIGVSSYGDIQLISGPNTRAYTQIGHGGHNQDTLMNLSGDIHVISENGNLLVKAGTGFESYALIGHGDDQDNNTLNARGTRQGRIHVIADGITLDRNGNRIAWIGHTFDMATDVQNPFADQALATPGDNLAGGYEVIGRSGLRYLNAGTLQGNGNITVTDSFRDRIITPNLLSANFAMSGGNLIINSVIDATTSYLDPATHGNSVTFLAAGDIDVNRRIQSPGSGSVNLIAGAGLANTSIVDAPSRTGGVSGTNLNFQRIDHLWHLPTGYIDMSLVRGDGLQWGNDNGISISSGEFSSAAGEISINASLNGTNATLAVGSKSGDTHALGYGVSLIGGNSSDEYAQLGYNTDAAGDPATGNVWVAAKTGGVLVQSGTAARTSSQVGHGGNGGNTNVKDLAGTISVRADGGGAVGNVSVLSGTGDTGQAQIGHGGRQNDGSHGGDILVIGEAITVTSAASAAQIGHGGFQGTGSYTGNLFINFDPLANGGAGVAVGGGGALSITAGGGFDDHAQIGHGGVVASGGSRTGNIIVGQSASVTLQGGTNKSTSAQLGHGGVGSGAGAFSGDIELTTTGNVSVLAGASAAGQGSAFAQIGHGGTGASGAKSGNITINALGSQITVAGPDTAVVSNSNFAQIGHGGDAAGNSLTGNIDINAPNAGLSLLAGNQARAFAKVGHGGYNSGGTQSGTIDLLLGGAVNLSGGGDHSFAQIGHGGSLVGGNRDGAISLESSTGNLSLLSGAGLNAFTQIGHGGVGVTGNHGSSLADGAIEVGIAGNILLNSGGGTDAYTQIGQGGSGAAGNHLGDICVHADGTITFNNGLHGAGTRAYGQIGHGGYNAAGNHSGEVTVVSGFVNNGGISMQGGSGTDQYVQIGHGGTNASGNLSGRVYVVADKDGDLVMSGGTGSGTYAMISHGDGFGTYTNFGSGTTGGTRQGGIQTFVDGDAILNAGTGANSNVYLIHRTNDGGGLNNTNYLGGDGYQYVVNGTSIGNAAASARENEGTIIAGNFGTGNIVITNTGDLTLNNPLVPTAEFVNHSFSFIVLSTGNLNFERSFQNAGTGLVALVAGWDGVQDLSSINYNNGPCDPEIIPGSIDFNDCARFGQNGGVLTVGSTSQSGPFAVGSRQGQTILRGYQINVVGSNSTAGGSTQIGFRADGSGDISGTIDIEAKQGGLQLIGGAADNSFVQIGHGSGSGAFANNVTSAATIDISFCEPGAVSVTGGGNGSFAMIGNGGGSGSYTRHGNVTLTDFSAVTLGGGTGTGAYAQIGNGGLGGSGAINSAVTLNGEGLVSVNGGAGLDAYARIGSGGRHTGAFTGATRVTTTGGLGLSGGNGNNAYAQIGAGGGGSVGAANTLDSLTQVISTGGVLTMNGGGGTGAYTQIGAGGLNADATSLNGAVTVNIDGTISSTGGTGADAYAQIGVGGSGSDGTKGGAVSVSGTAVTLSGGTGAGANVLVGNGGGRIQAGSDGAGGTITGDTSVTTTAGAVTMNAAGGSTDNFVQIGAGGRGSVGSANSVTSATTVTTTGGGLTLDGTNAAYLQIGAGGQGVSGTDAASLNGNVLVTVDGTLSMSGGAGSNRYAQIGNGGSGFDSTKTGNTTVSANSLSMTSGSGSGANVLIGLGGGMDQSNNDFAGGALTGNVLVTTVDGVTVNAAPAGVHAFAQIGNGGLVSDGNMDGTTTVNSAGAVVLTAGTQSNTAARIGAGGSGVDGTLTNAATTVTGTSLSMTGGSSSSAYTQIGAGGGATGGGNLFLGSISGDTRVTMSGAITMSGGTGGSAFSQIGAGGAGVNGSAPGNTITSATNVTGTSVSLNSNSGNGAYVQIGAGGGTTGVGTNTPYQGSITGDVQVTATAGGVTLGGTASGTRGYAQIGAGGGGIDGGLASLGAANTIQSATTVNTTGGGVTLDSSLSAYTQIGAGGFNADGTLNGAVTVNADGALSLSGGVGTRRSAQIGNGGHQSNGNKTGAIQVTATSVALNGGTTERAYAHIGHGGADASGVVSAADISVNALGAITLRSGGNQAYTQIGHGGFGAIDLTVSNAAVTLNSNAGTGTGDVSLVGGSGTNASAVIGHGGARTDGTANTGNTSASGNVTIAKSANVTLAGGGNSDSFAQIGHAGERAIADFSGNLLVNTAGAVSITGGNTAGSGAYGQIGHGGRIQTGTKTGSVTVNALGGLSLLGGTTSSSSAQVGHGGNTSAGDISGVIALSIGGDVSLSGGSAGETYAQIGHGGHLATGSFAGDTTLNFDLGTQSVTGAAGALSLSAGGGNNAFVQIGHGGTSNNGSTNAKSGNVIVAGVTSATLSGGTGAGVDSYAQIGHGGDENDGNATGSVGLLASGPVTLNGGTSSDSYVHIGLGGHEATGNFGATGDIVSVAGMGIALNAGAGERSSVQIGSGGFNADGDLIGNVFVNVNPLTGDPVGGGAITMAGGAGTDAFTRIGLGGTSQFGTKTGNTTVLGSSVSLASGAGGGSYAHLGAGSGINASTSDFGGGAVTTNTLVTATAGGVSVSAAGGGAHAFAQIGGGGLIADGALSGNNALSTVVTATGDIVLTGGGQSNTYALIGLGGSGGDGVKSLAGTSVTGASVTLNGGSNSSAYAQIGSGGGSTGGNNSASGAVTGNTTVTATSGDVNLNSGSGSNAYARIGAGGANLPGDLTGDTLVNAAGAVALNSALGGAGGFTQIGLGGFNADGVHTGITTVAAGGAVSLSGGAANDSFAMIGSGGAGSDNSKVNANVSVRGASVALTSGSGGAAFTQIGSGGGTTSGGAQPGGNVTGSVSVATTTGGISLLGGGDRAYSQIGNGGGGRNGDHTGEIQIVSADGLGLTGGTAARAYALIGHGGAADAGGYTTGLRQGNLLVRAQGLTSLADGSSAAFLGHVGASGVSGASRLALVTGQLDTSANATGVSTMIANMIGSGDVEIGVTDGDLVIDGASIAYNSANTLDLVASGNTTFQAGIQNAGSGAINGVAGWDGSTGLIESINPLNPTPIAALSLDAPAILADPSAYGNDGGVLSVADGSQSTAIAVGSATGETNLFGDAVRVMAGSTGVNQYAQIGYRGTAVTPITGNINLGVGLGGIEVSAGGQSGSFAQIGHGGAGAAAAPIDAVISLAFNDAGDLIVSGGSENAYAQIGHGGRGYNSSLSGDITANGAGTLALSGGVGQTSYAQIGHGGDGSFGAKVGNIELTAAEASLIGGSGARSYAQIGNGGRGGIGNVTGNVALTTTSGDVEVAAGSALSSTAQIGHGGQNYNGLVANASILVDAAGNVVVAGGSVFQTSAMIGHGGGAASSVGLGGDVTVLAGGDLSVTGGSSLTSFAQIGHGGAQVTTNITGNIAASADGNIVLSAPASETAGAYAKIGHGDDMRGGYAGTAGSGNRNGNITVAAGGDLSLAGALVGHVNATSLANPGGTTMVGVSRLDPSDPSGGSVIADAGSQFSGGEIRFYLPRRGNNQIAIGALLHGVPFAGGLSDPSPVQGPDEYTDFVQTSGGTIRLAEHDSSFGSGPAPTIPGTFAFYFDTIVEGTPPLPPVPPTPPAPPAPPAPDYRSSILADRVIDDWIRDEERRYSAPGITFIYYDGLKQYGPNGEPIFDFNGTPGLGSEDEEDVLRRQLRILEEQSEQAEESGEGGNSQGAE